MPRWFLGVVAVGFSSGGLVLAFIYDPGPDELAWGGVLLRSGLIFGAWWLVLPNAKRVKPSTWWAIATVAFVLAIRPRLILWGLVGGVVVAFAMRRAGRSG